MLGKRLITAFAMVVLLPACGEEAMGPIAEEAPYENVFVHTAAGGVTMASSTTTVNWDVSGEILITDSGNTYKLVHDTDGNGHTQKIHMYQNNVYAGFLVPTYNSARDEIVGYEVWFPDTGYSTSGDMNDDVTDWGDIGDPGTCPGEEPGEIDEGGCCGGIETLQSVNEQSLNTLESGCEETLQMSGYYVGLDGSIQSLNEGGPDCEDEYDEHKRVSGLSGFSFVAAGLATLGAIGAVPVVGAGIAVGAAIAAVGTLFEVHDTYDELMECRYPPN
jgi:hypothetical protein